MTDWPQLREHIRTLLSGIRAGHISNGTDAMDHLGMSRVHMWRVVKAARRQGHTIATRTGGPWRVLRKGNGK